MEIGLLGFVKERPYSIRSSSDGEVVFRINLSSNVCEFSKFWGSISGTLECETQTLIPALFSPSTVVLCATYSFVTPVFIASLGSSCGAHVFEGFFGLEHEPVKSVKMHDFNPKCEDALGESSKTNSRTLKTAGEAQRYDLHFLVSPIKRYEIVGSCQEKFSYNIPERVPTL